MKSRQKWYTLSGIENNKVEKKIVEPEVWYYTIGYMLIAFASSLSKMIVLI